MKHTNKKKKDKLLKKALLTGKINVYSGFVCHVANEAKEELGTIRGIEILNNINICR